MIQISKIWVASLDLDHIDVWWETKGYVQDPLLYSFYIQRSESPLGPWDTLGGPFKDKWYFRDTTVNQKHRMRAYYYRVRIVEDGTAREIFSEVASLSAERDLIAEEIVRRFSLLLREFVGRKAWLYPVRTFGARCPDCWDKVRQRRLKDKCETCYSAGFSGGYYSPIEILLQIDPEGRAIQVGSAGENADSKTTARCLPFPPIKPNDIIIEAENVRWRVMSLTSTEKLRSTVHLELQLHQIFPGDIAYKLPVNVDTKNLAPSPGREFVNPHGVDELKERDPGLDMVLSAYGYPFTR